ncbi:type III pantothenate kinase [bacterium]|nr:type III pantothenate kinase [bacterium]
MLLTVDIGNTNVTLGVFDNDNLLQSWRLSTKIARTEDEYGIFLTGLLKEYNITDCAICSVVVELTDKFNIAVEKYLGIKAFIINHKIKLNVGLKTEENSKIGADRIANAAAAVEFYKLPAIVVDFGTATTFDVISDKKEFIGGIIAAGMNLQAEGLGTKTSKLPKLNIEKPKKTIAANTIDAMLAGIVTGHARMIDGLIEDCEKELGQKATIIGTGGYSDVISPLLKRKFDDVSPNLTLLGIKKLFELNLE